MELLNEPKVIDEQIKEILKHHERFSEDMASLASVKDQKMLSKLKLSEEFKAMIKYIREFAGLKDENQAEQYLEYMIKSTNVLQLASHVKKTQVDQLQKEKEEYEKSKTEVQKQIERQDSSLTFPKPVPVAERTQSEFQPEEEKAQFK